MNRADIKELHFITDIVNVPSLLQVGIASRNRAIKKGIPFADISEPGVQDRRKVKKIPGTSKELHDYANLYFDAHNPMLSRRRSMNDKICVLRVHKDVLDLDGVIVTDQNAARGCWFKSVAEGLSLLDKNQIYMVNWKNRDNPMLEYEQEGIKCSEVLVPEAVNSRYIIGIYVANQTALEELKKICNLSVEINTDLFFYGGY